mmetsp:Transcript_46713/g.141537  ORF Transcript_46713/g.141537 Transcript_46713/m.141537 type:complete len:166 (+) Transcript_46713:2094-2591(+)
METTDGPCGLRLGHLSAWLSASWCETTNPQPRARSAVSKTEGLLDNAATTSEVCQYSGGAPLGLSVREDAAGGGQRGSRISVNASNTLAQPQKNGESCPELEETQYCNMLTRDLLIARYHPGRSGRPVLSFVEGGLESGLVHNSLASARWRAMPQGAGRESILQC